MWEWLGQPTFSLFFLVGCGSALLGLALAALPHRASSHDQGVLQVARTT
jgi:hypothetical protein